VSVGDCTPQTTTSDWQDACRGRADRLCDRGGGRFAEPMGSSFSLLAHGMPGIIDTIGRYRKRVRQPWDWPQQSILRGGSALPGDGFHDSRYAASGQPDPRLRQVYGWIRAAGGWGASRVAARLNDLAVEACSACVARNHLVLFVPLATAVLFLVRGGHAPDAGARRDIHGGNPLLLPH